MNVPKVVLPPLVSPPLTLNLRTEMAMADGIVSHKITKKPPTSLAHPLSSARTPQVQRELQTADASDLFCGFVSTNEFSAGEKAKERRLRQRRGGCGNGAAEGI